MKSPEAKRATADPFPRDSGTKRIYVVRESRVLHINDRNHFPGGTEILLTPSRAESVKNVVTLPVEEVKSESPGGKTRAMKARKRG